MITQINSLNPAVHSAVARKLEGCGVVVSNQHLQEFMITPLQDIWENYEMTVSLLSSIAQSSFHTVLNTQGVVTHEMSIQMLQAMQHGRQIILSELPNFSDDVDTYTQRLISSRLHIFTIVDLAGLSISKYRSLLRRVPRISVDYELASGDKVLIGAKIRSHLRTLVQPITSSPTALVA